MPPLLLLLLLPPQSAPHQASSSNGLFSVAFTARAGMTSRQERRACDAVSRTIAIYIGLAVFVLNNVRDAAGGLPNVIRIGTSLCCRVSTLVEWSGTNLPFCSAYIHSLKWLFRAFSLLLFLLLLTPKRLCFRRCLFVC